MFVLFPAEATNITMTFTPRDTPLKIVCWEEIAYTNGCITHDQLGARGVAMRNSLCGRYMIGLESRAETLHAA